MLTETVTDLGPSTELPPTDTPVTGTQSLLKRPRFAANKKPRAQEIKVEQATSVTQIGTDTPASNTSTGVARTGARRLALSIHQRWLDIIISGRKTLEIRGGKCSMREQIGLTQSQAARIVGYVQIVDRVELSASEFQAAEAHHGIPPSKQNEVANNYKHIYAWHVARRRRYGTHVHFKVPHKLSNLPAAETEAVLSVVLVEPTQTAHASPKTAAARKTPPPNAAEPAVVPSSKHASSESARQ